LKGGEFDAETKGIPFLYKGVPSVLTIVRDITERKKAEKALLEREEHYRHLVEAIPLAIMLVDEGKRVVSANAEAVKLFKAGRPEDLIGKSVMDFILPENRGIVGERLRGTLAEGADAPTRETELLALNGERVQVEVSGIPLIYQGRTSALSLFRDITERKKTQETLLRFERLAAVGKVIAAIAHEIRNPLAVVSGMSQILKAKLENQPEFSKDLETILSQAERLKYFLNDILDFSRSMEIRKMEIDAKGLLEASLAFARAQMGPQVGSTQVKWKFEKSLPKLLADRGRLEQVLINLIINAYQALAGAGTITLSAKTKDNMMLLGVEDNGPGVPESDIARLFEPFFTTKKGGSGLGLSISQKIVETHSGRITVKQISPHGMLFTLHLPLS
jgi:two-component system sporulation sensor kinase A